MEQMIELMAAPFAACVVLVGIHAYLGTHVIQRKIIFVDLALAQIAALGERDRYFPGLRSWVGFRQAGVEVERPSIQISVLSNRGGLEISLDGVVRAGDTEVPIALGHTDSGEWSFELPVSSLEIPAVGEFLEAVGYGNVVEQLPPGVADLGGINLTRLSIGFAPATRTLTDLALGLEITFSISN